MDVQFPIIVLERDSGDILKFESMREMQTELEPIDVENGEYCAWDSRGKPLSLSTQDPVWLRLESAGIDEISGRPDLDQALSRFIKLSRIHPDAEKLGLQEKISVLRPSNSVRPGWMRSFAERLFGKQA